jgi:nitroreductase
MLDNPVLQAMLNRKSIRKYRDEMPSDEVIAAVVLAGEHAPFASQLGSLLLSRNIKKNAFHAPLLFTICLDAHRWELIMARRGWQKYSSDWMLLMLGMQDAAYMAENMVIAAESLGMGSCFLGAAPLHADRIAKKYHLPLRVFPLVQLSMGYPAENPPTRPRYPLDFTLFEDRYPELTEEQISRAMQVMDEGYLAQDYYVKEKIRIPLADGREDPFDYDTYSWTEHICRKWGQPFFPDILKEQFEKRGFDFTVQEPEAEPEKA